VLNPLGVIGQALGREDVRGRRLLTLQTPQSAQLVILQRMHAGRPRLDAPHVQPASRKLDLVPLQITQLERPQSAAQRHARALAKKLAVFSDTSYYCARRYADSVGKTKSRRQ
jgi:hypothetical protein